MFIINSSDDDIIQIDDIKALENVHGLSHTDFITLNDSTRIPMVSAFSDFTSSLLKWIDEYY